MYKSTFMGLNTALRGVLAQQTALDVTGQNIANLSTEGYTRQRVELSATQAWSSASNMSQVSPGQLGTGVEALRIQRLRDAFIDSTVRQQFGSQTSAQTLVDQLGQVEAALQEPGAGGISALMDSFWSSMDAVAANPQSLAARQSFAQAAQALAGGFNRVGNELLTIEGQSDSRLNSTVGEINSITSRIAAINTEVHKATDRGQQPNDLLDERDRLLDSLSKIMNITTSTDAFGEVTVTYGPTAQPLVTAVTGATTMTRAALDTAYTAGDLTSGRAFADEQLWDPAAGIIPSLRLQLDTLVSTFVGGINGGNAAGFDLTGAPGGAIFDAGGTTATTMRLDIANNILNNPNLIAAASSWGGAGEPGNGANLSAMLDVLRPSAQAGLGGISFAQYYSNTVTGVAARTQTEQANANNADALVELAVGRRDQESSVSLDEEMSNMLRFQHAYNASARLMTTVDEMLDTIINRMGTVGL